MDTAKILIVEDDLIIASHIASIVEEAGYKVAEILTKGESAISYIEGNQVDVILMDIQLSGELDGIETAKILNADRTLPILFLTANSDESTFKKSKEAYPVGFISKPFKNEDLLRTLEIVLNMTFAKSEASMEDSKESILKDRIFVRDKNKMVKLKIEEILYVEALRNYCKVVTKLKSYTLSIPLLKFEKKVSSQLFIRIHRSHLVNIKAIDELDENYVFINGKPLAVSKSYKQELAKKLTVV